MALDSVTLVGPSQIRALCDSVLERPGGVVVQRRKCPCCPCSQALPEVPAWLSKTRPRATRVERGTCQVSVELVPLGVFHCLRQFTRSGFVVRWSGRMDHQLVLGNMAAMSLAWDSKNETRRGMAGLQNSEDCAQRSHPSPGLVIWLNQNPSPNGQPEAQGRRVPSSPASLEASGLLPPLPTL